MQLLNPTPQNHGLSIARCKTSCLVCSLEALIPSIPAACLPNLHKCSTSLMVRRMERRIKAVLCLIHLPTLQVPRPPFPLHLPTSWGPRPFLILTSWDSSQTTSHHHLFHQTSILPTALGHHRHPLSPQRAISTQLSDTTYLWTLQSRLTLIVILAPPEVESGSMMDDQQVAHSLLAPNGR